jgi:hypothetical protein
MRNGLRLLKLEHVWPPPGCPLCHGFLPLLIDDDDADDDDLDTACASCGRLRRPVLRIDWERV